MKITRKILSVILALTLLVIIAPASFAATNTDVRDANELVDAITINDAGNLSLTVNNTKELEKFTQYIEEHNKNVEVLWNKSKEREHTSQYKEDASLSSLASTSLRTSAVLYKSGSVPDWRLGYYCTYYGTSSSISNVSNVYAFDAGTYGSTDISNFEYQTRIIDSSRTIACNTSVRIEIYNVFGHHLDTQVLSEYMEWYASGGGYIW